jgi:acyl-CoA reductase-like NAD-dependent aldehyde dehydrogenase
VKFLAPLLPIKTYRNSEEVGEYMEAHPLSLAVYIYINDKELAQHTQTGSLPHEKHL